MRGCKRGLRGGWLGLRRRDSHDDVQLYPAISSSILLTVAMGIGLLLGLIEAVSSAILPLR